MYEHLIEYVGDHSDKKEVANRATDLINEHTERGWHFVSLTATGTDRGVYVTFRREVLSL